ncbi:MAG: hypothetical protein HY908_20685 [Myxococcales bacterium]|nr:hypothetical protein [Myxococcales bacterium]
MSELDLRLPAWVERVPAWLDGQPTTRLIFIFRAIGCAYARRLDGGCTMCGFAEMSTKGERVPPEDLVAQLDSVLDAPGALDGVGEVDLYNSGSFFADQEIPPEVRAHVLGRLGRSTVRRVLVEARPEHVKAHDLAAARAALGDRELEVGIGLESADDHVREVLIHKGFGRADFERAARVLGEAGARLLAYLIIKPPGLSEAEAVEDAVASARYVFEVAARTRVRARAAYQPTFVARGALVEREFQAGRYQPPSLWSVVAIVRRAHASGELTVGLSDEGLEPHRLPSGCAACTPRLRAALAEYNRTRELGALEGLACACAGAGACE